MKTRLAVGMLLLVCAAASAMADNGNWLTAVQDWPLAQAEKPKAGQPAAGPVEKVQQEQAEAPAKKCPFNFTIDYTLISDYVFRGVNLSEYPREGREKLNHQLNVNPEFNLGNYGVFGAVFWFEWFAAQEQLTPGYGRDIQEVDYSVYYRYTFEDLGLTPEVGWVAYTLPPIGRDAHTDYEFYIKLAYSDGKLFGTKENILNPYVAYYHNLDLGANASWWEVGVNHEFALADYGMKDCPVMRHVSLIPSAIYGVQHRLFGKLNPDLGGPTTSAVNILFGLEIALDLNGAFNLPEQYGSLTLSGLLFYSQALDHALVNDEFFGGMKVGYQW